MFKLKHDELLANARRATSPVTDRMSQDPSTKVFLLEDDINKESQQKQVIKT